MVGASPGPVQTVVVWKVVAAWAVVMLEVNVGWWGWFEVIPEMSMKPLAVVVAAAGTPPLVAVPVLQVQVKVGAVRVAAPHTELPGRPAGLTQSPQADHAAADQQKVTGP